MRSINVLLAVLVSVALALLVFEGGLRLVAPAFRPVETINQFHPKLGWVKRTDAEVDRKTSEFDITFHTNAQGLRHDADIALQKRPNTFRTMMLGDSFVLGYTVDREDLFLDLLERWWHKEERRAQVVNAGTEGYSTDQEVAWFQEYGKAYGPDLVLLFPYENDLYWNGQTQYNRFPKPRFRPDGKRESGELEDPGPGSKLSKTAIGRFFQIAILPRFQRNDGPPPHHFQPQGTDTWVYSEFAPLFEDQPDFMADAVARTRGALTALKRDCDAIGARLVMVPIPSESAIHPEERAKFQETALAGVPEAAWSPDRPVDTFLSLARELDIDALDARAFLRARAEKGGEPLYFDREWHFNPAGNRAFAEFLHDELETINALPEEHSALTAAAMPEAPPQPTGLAAFVGSFAIKLFAGLWLVLGTLYCLTYRDEKAPLAFLKVGGMLALVFGIVLGGTRLLGSLSPEVSQLFLIVFLLGILGFVAYKLGRRLGTITELIKAFTLRGHWYLMPLVVVLLTIGSLLVVAASSPLIAPFIYTLF